MTPATYIAAGIALAPLALVAMPYVVWTVAVICAALGLLP